MSKKSKKNVQGIGVGDEIHIGGSPPWRTWTVARVVGNSLEVDMHLISSDIGSTERSYDVTEVFTYEDGQWYRNNKGAHPSWRSPTVITPVKKNPEDTPWGSRKYLASLSDAELKRERQKLQAYGPYPHSDRQSAAMIESRRQMVEDEVLRRSAKKKAKKQRAKPKSNPHSTIAKYLKGL